VHTASNKNVFVKYDVSNQVYNIVTMGILTRYKITNGMRYFKQTDCIYHGAIDRLTAYIGSQRRPIYYEKLFSNSGKHDIQMQTVCSTDFHSDLRRALWNSGHTIMNSKVLYEKQLFFTLKHSVFDTCSPIFFLVRRYDFIQSSLIGSILSSELLATKYIRKRCLMPSLTYRF
jgi:hypothetical protein